MDEWIKELSPADLSGLMAQIAEMIGVENALKLAQGLGGLNVYIPKADTVLAAIRDRRIKAEYSAGNSVRELARRYNLSEVWVRKILTDQGIHPDQVALF